MGFISRRVFRVIHERENEPEVTHGRSMKMGTSGPHAQWKMGGVDEVGTVG